MATLPGTAGNDRISGTSANDAINLLAGNDVAFGNGGNDIINGGAGNDGLVGRTGNDRLFGGIGNDSLEGGAGHDNIHGDAGGDRMGGGEGADTFFFSHGDSGDLFAGEAIDRIVDFGPDDVINLNAVGGLYFDGFEGPEPSEGGFSIWGIRNNIYISWTIGGETQDVELTGAQDIFLDQILYRPLPDDFAADSSTTGRVQVGGSAEGRLEIPGDHDWFRVTLQAGQDYEIALSGQSTGGGTLLDPFLALRRGNGTVVAENDDFDGVDSRIFFTPGATGTFFIDAGAFDDAFAGTYTLTVA